MTTLTSRPALPAYVQHGTSVPYTLETAAAPQSDFLQYLIARKAVTAERIAGTTGDWKAYWQAEYSEIDRCIHALGDQA